RVRHDELANRFWALEVDELVACSVECRAEHAADLPATAVQRQLHAARASADGFSRRTAARKTRSVGPIPEIESFPGASRCPASSATSPASTASSSAMIRSNESSSVSVINDLPSLVI